MGKVQTLAREGFFELLVGKIVKAGHNVISAILPHLHQIPKFPRGLRLSSLRTMFPDAPQAPVSDVCA